MVQGTPGQTRPQKPCLLRESLHRVRKPRAFKRGLFRIGATAAQAEAAFNQAGLNWGKEAVSAALYLGTSVNPEGGILVNGSLTDAGATAESGKVNLAAGSLLMVDAAAVGEKAVTGTVSAVLSD